MLDYGKTFDDETELMTIVTDENRDIDNIEKLL